MNRHKLLASLLLITISILLPTVEAQEFQDLYCGDKNCYEVLGLSRETATKRDIGRAYRKLAGKWHPDMFRTTDEKEKAEKVFLQIASAYETLKDDESRNEYDYMMDHPEEMWRNYYRYYRRRVGPKVDVRIVVAVLISVISLGQYYFAATNYSEAIKCLSMIPKYRIQATQIAKEEGLLKRDKKQDRFKSKEMIKEEEEAVIRKIIEDKMDIRGGYAKPCLTDVLWIQLVILPVTIYRWSKFYMRWLWKFRVMREEYGEQEKLYVIRKFLKVSQGQFDQMPEEEVEDMMDKELWIKDKFKEWKRCKEEEMRIKMAQSGRYKQYRRYMKNHGGDRMTFDDS